MRYLGIEGIKNNDAYAIESAIQFLERNEYSFASGYMKEEILQALKKPHLNQNQIKRMHAVILNVLHYRILREFKYYCRFARKISSPDLIEKIKELTLSEDGDTAFRATWMLSIVMGKRYEKSYDVVRSLTKYKGIRNRFIDSYVIITGAPSSAATDILKSLQKKGFKTVEYSPDNEVELTTSEKLKYLRLLVNAIENYSSQDKTDYTFFQVGFPNFITHFYMNNLPVYEEFTIAAKSYRYNKLVFLDPPDLEQAQDINQTEELKIHNAIKQAYLDCGYSVVELRKGDIETKAEFILHELTESKPITGKVPRSRKK